MKKQQRRLAYDVRNAQSNKAKLSQIICNKFIAQEEYQQADTVMWYLHCRSEVKTHNSIISALNSQKKIVIPYCTKDDFGQNKLGLWLLEDIAELQPGTWGILEPPRTRWGEQGKEIYPEMLDLIMIPGVAFDCRGGRLGNGGGYYDRLLLKVRPDTFLTAVCFESQIVHKVIMETHDVRMNAVITEQNCYRMKKNGC